MTPWVKRLLIANVGMYFLQLTAPMVTYWLMFVPSEVLLRPWTIVTYMFLHDTRGFTHILFNMLGLFFFGPRVESRLGPQRFFVLYFLSGISGALVSFVFARDAQIVGASAAVFGVMLAFALFWPREKIYIWGVLPVEARWLVVITTALALWSGLQGSQGGVADFAHLGGYAGAFVYLKWLEQAQGARRFRTKAVAKVADASLGKWRQVDTQSVHEVNRDEVNRILDKINARGLGSLTPQERLFLSNFVPPDDRVPPAS
jgi:membrane associated rhomboid family serine protease